MCRAEIARQKGQAVEGDRVELRLVRGGLFKGVLSSLVPSWRTTILWLRSVLLDRSNLFVAGGRPPVTGIAFLVP